MLFAISDGLNRNVLRLVENQARIISRRQDRLQAQRNVVRVKFGRAKPIFFDRGTGALKITAAAVDAFIDVGDACVATW